MGHGRYHGTRPRRRLPRLRVWLPQRQATSLCREFPIGIRSADEAHVVCVQEHASVALGQHGDRRQNVQKHTGTAA
jgi:hypothetical protein